MTTRDDLLHHLDTLLQPELFKDYCHNGLQVQGKGSVYKLVSGVTASQALIEAAINAGADALLVHHGLFWRGFNGQITGWIRQRLALLMVHNINLFAYHLPLDAHAQWGNNAQLGRVLGFAASGRFGEQSLGWLGAPATASYADATALASHVENALGHPVVLVQGKPGPVRNVAWCTGGAQGYFEEAICSGVDAFITGEISEPQAHYARECGVSFLACGHHASERYGAQALGGHVAAQLGLEHVFIDIDNPA
jgi:dinuclear metal center YbgI/SA1388 family protein